jgi:hypothetical protein
MDGQPDGEGRSFFPRATTWLVTSIGLTGALYAVGYVIEASYQEFLGILTAPSGTLDYLLAAGEFALTVVRAFVDLLLNLPRLGREQLTFTLVVILLAAVGLAVIAWLVFGGHARRAWHGASARHAHYWPSRRLWLAASFVVMILSGFEMWWLAWPTLPIENVLVAKDLLRDRFGADLFRPPWVKSPENAPTPVVRARTLQIWKDIVCSRLESAPPGVCGRRLFLESIFLTGVLTWLTVNLVLIPGNRRGLAHSVSWDGGTGLAALLLLGSMLVNVGSLLQAYSRIARPTEAREIVAQYQTGGVIIRGTFQDGPDSVVRLVNRDDENRLWEIPRAQVRAIRRWEDREGSVAYDPGGNIYDFVHGWLIADSDKRMTLFEKDLRLIWEIPRDKVRTLMVEQVSDVLNDHFRTSYQQTYPSEPLPKEAGR